MKFNLWIIAFMVHAFCVLRNLCRYKGQKDFFLCYLLELYLQFQLLHLLSIFSYSPQGPPSVFLRSIIAPPIKLKSKSQTCHLTPWPSLFMWSIIKSYPFYSLKSRMDIFFNILLYHHLNLDLLQQPPKWSLCQSPEPPPDSFSYCYGFKNRNSEKSSEFSNPCLMYCLHFPTLTLNSTFSGGLSEPNVAMPSSHPLDLVNFS